LNPKKINTTITIAPIMIVRSFWFFSINRSVLLSASSTATIPPSVLSCFLTINDYHFIIQGAKVNLFLDLASPKEFINFVSQSCNQLIIKIMGKGDKKSKRGKILMGSYGVRRRHKKGARATVAVAVKEVVAPVKVPKEKPSARPKAEVEEIKAEAPVAEIALEVAEKPAKKKSPPKAKAPAKKEEKTE
jgi:ribosomal small subunit protein bTHX